MTITPELLRTYFPRLVDVDVWVDALNEAMDRFAITTADRQAAFLAQVAHECGVSALTIKVRLVENLNYSAQGLRATWPSRFPSMDLAAHYARKPELIANRVYAGRYGNGDEASGDGWRFRGRGLIQLTFRDNYVWMGELLGMDLRAHPDLLEQPFNAALSAAAFWEARGCNELADDLPADDDDADYRRITKVINGGYHGLRDRQARWQRTKAAVDA